MKNFKKYDDAVANHYKGLKMMNFPLISWDFHQINMAQIVKTYSDLAKINKISSTSKWNSQTWDFKSRLTEEVVVITDTSLKIVFASNGLSKMNGYVEKEVLGKTPKIFHGMATCSIISNEIREAINSEVPFEKTVVNYKKNGETYICEIKGFPIFNSKGDLSHFIAFEKAA